MAVNTIMVENLARSIVPPTTSAAVMAAKVIWKAMKMYSGISTPSLKVAAPESAVTPFRKTLPKSAMKALPVSPNAIE